MSKLNKNKSDILYKEISSYSSIYQNRPALYRVVETFVFASVLFFLSGFMPGEGWPRITLLIATLVLFLMGAPYFYKIWLSPTYTLKKDALIVRIGKKERQFPLTEVERASVWKPTFHLNGKKENLMVTKDFVDRLEEQIARVSKARKR